MINFKLFETKEEIIKYLKETKDIPCQTSKEAEKYLREHLPKESYYQNKIIRHIKELIPSAFVWKAAAGPYSRGGIPDICAVIDGQYFGFEVKRPFIGVLSDLQQRTISQIQCAGGKAYVVTYPEEVTEILRNETEIMISVSMDQSFYRELMEKEQKQVQKDYGNAFTVLDPRYMYEW